MVTKVYSFVTIHVGQSHIYSRVVKLHKTCNWTFFSAQSKHQTTKMLLKRVKNIGHKARIKKNACIWMNLLHYQHNNCLTHRGNCYQKRKTHNSLLDCVLNYFINFHGCLNRCKMSINTKTWPYGPLIFRKRLDNKTKLYSQDLRIIFIKDHLCSPVCNITKPSACRLRN
jgi:hypothetical protein